MRFAYADDSGYAALGLSGNPFVAESEPGVAADLWIARDGVPSPPQPGQRRLIQLIGPKGAGKTSHLLRWCALAPGPVNTDLWLGDHLQLAIYGEAGEGPVPLEISTPFWRWPISPSAFGP